MEELNAARQEKKDLRATELDQKRKLKADNDELAKVAKDRSALVKPSLKKLKKAVDALQPLTVSVRFISIPRALQVEYLNHLADATAMKERIDNGTEPDNYIVLATKLSDEANKSASILKSLYSSLSK